MYKYKSTIKKYWYCFVFGPIFMILEACGEFILPFTSANIINVGVKNHDMNYILEQGGIMVLMAIAMLITGVLGAFFGIRGAAHIAMDVRRMCFKKIMDFSFENVDDFSSGSLITRVTNDVTQIQNFTQSLLRGVFRSPVMMTGAIVMSFIMSPKLALILCIVVPALALAIYILIRIASPRYVTMQQMIDSLNNNTSEVLTNEYVIKSFVREDYECKRFSKVNDNLMKHCIRALRVMIFLQPISTVAVSVATVGVIYVGGKQIIMGEMEIGVLTAFITYLTQVLVSINFLANIALQGTRAIASDKRIDEVLKARITLTDDEAEHKDQTVTSGSIEFRGVSFKYFKNNSDYDIKNIDLKIESSMTVGVIGSTGCGKTTLISMIPRLYDPDQGSVLVGGLDVRDYSLEHIRDAVSIVLQKNVLFSGTIADNLRWGNAEAKKEDIELACRIACADEFIGKLSDGYDSEVQHGGANFSGGQRQRLCIARALVKKPKILILDDSTSAVDMATDAKIRRSLKTYMSDVTKIVIAQRIDSVMESDMIIVMDEGAVVGTGTHEELLRNCDIYKEIYYSQKDEEAV